MLSRAANAIYWVCRYIERAENIARLMDVNFTLTLDLPGGLGEQWKPLVVISGDSELFDKRYKTATRENVIKFLTFDTENPNSILSCLRSARENARSIREILSSEMWEQINGFYLMVSDAAAGQWVSDMPSHFFNEVKKGSHLFIGVTNTTLSHNEGWNFCRLGRDLERADKISRLLDLKYFVLLPTVHDVGTPFDDIQWTAVLQSASALEMYRKCYHYISPKQIIEFLVLNREFPRSIMYCLTTADDSLHSITGTPSGTFRNAAEQRLGQLRSQMAFTQVQEIVTQGLHEFVDGFQIQLNQIGKEIFNTFFALRPLETQSIPIVRSSS